MRNIRLLIEYDGTDFVGWQSQANGRSVQEEVTKVLCQILQAQVHLIGSGRTDSGVHARGQAANFRTFSGMRCESILRALNGLLPRDIRVCAADEVPEDFHARYDARERVYRYYISRTPRAVGRQYHWFVKYELDLALMKGAAADILGEHDFTSFCKNDREESHRRCTIIRSEWTVLQDELVYEVRANRFLHGMVRALVGTMVDIGRAHLPGSALKDILEARDRSLAGTSAPACGLFLEQVLY